MVNSLGAYVQNVFISTPQTEQQQPQAAGNNVGTPSMLAGLPVGMLSIMLEHPVGNQNLR